MRNRLHPRATRNITRIEGGWWVRILFSESPVSKVFSDSKNGGRDKALSAAQSFRDSELKRLPPPSRGGVPLGPGRVFQERKSWKDAGGRVHVYLAWIRMEPGRPASTSYSVKKHGNIGARLKADDWLLERTRERKLRA